MKKLVLCSAVALAMSAGGVLAKDQTVTITIDGACDAFSITVHGENVGLSEDNPVCDLAIGSGYIGTVNRRGKYAIIGAILNNDATAHWVIGLQYPLVTGGSYTVGYTTDGVHIRNVRGSGTYTVSGTAAHGLRGNEPITSIVRK